MLSDIPGLVLAVALAALVVWAITKAIRNYRSGGDAGWKAYDPNARDGMSRSDRITSFLKFPWSQ